MQQPVQISRRHKFAAPQPVCIKFTASFLHQKAMFFACAFYLTRLLEMLFLATFRDEKDEHFPGSHWNRCRKERSSSSRAFPAHLLIYLQANEAQALRPFGNTYRSNTPRRRSPGKGFAVCLPTVSRHRALGKPPAAICNAPPQPPLHSPAYPSVCASILRALFHSRRRSSPRPSLLFRKVALASHVRRRNRPALREREGGPATMAEDRSWMYTGRQSRKKFTPEWLEKTTEFVERAFRILPPRCQAVVLCPCARCEFRLYRSKDEIQLHLFKNGFAPGYTVWVYHGERRNPQPAKPSDDRPKENGDLNGKKDGAGGGEQASKSAQGTKKWACARGKPPKKDQLWARAAAQGEGGPATMAEDRSWMYTAARAGTRSPPSGWRRRPTLCTCHCICRGLRSYQKYLWEQEKTKQHQQQSAPKAKRLRTSGSSAAKPAEEEGRNVSVPEPELEDTATSTANPATADNASGVQIPAGRNSV
ncbi:uncharacterized protein LOC119299555 [Triticum dicoccoides]|uniref:uncharacterized protein LOC119299555 n=1 Tax=Triticum dicoccoides TaxID=85692 RepID=UPI00188E7C68|nr:uncharacterized protein LOC119299555 [Triticum dicoccoides]